MLNKKCFQEIKIEYLHRSESVKELDFGKNILGHITLPIPDGVTDQNKVNFGHGTLNPVQKRSCRCCIKTFY